MGLLSQVEKHRVMLIRENRRIRLGKLPLKARHIGDPKTMAAWFLFREYLQVKRFFGKGTRMYLPIDERTALPVSPYSYHTQDDIKILTNPDNVAAESLSYTTSQTETENRRSRYYDFMSIGIMGVVAVFALVVILFLTGTLKIG